MSKQWALVSGGLVVIVITSSMLALLLDNDWWAYALAIGFLAFFAAYGIWYVRSRR